MSSCNSEGFTMQVCEDMFCRSDCKELPAMPIKERTCTYKGGKKRSSYYYSCNVEIPTLNFPLEELPEEYELTDEL